jgi:hypothetical protein
MTLEIIRPFICCPECHQRILLRIDSYPTFHYYPDGMTCPASWPERLMSGE